LGKEKLGKNIDMAVGCKLSDFNEINVYEE